MPDALELPGMRRAVVPLVRSRRAFVFEFVAHRGPGFAAIVGAVHHLAEPVGGLRGVDAIRVGWRAFQVIDIQPAEVGAVEIPFFARPVGGEDEGAFMRTDQDSNFAHGCSLEAKVEVYFTCRWRGSKMRISFLVLEVVTSRGGGHGKCGSCGRGWVCGGGGGG